MSNEAARCRGPAAAAVLDTNVVLDWLLFADPATAPLDAALRAGRLRWHATAAMLDELARVASEELCVRRGRPREQLLAQAREAVTLAPAGPQAALPGLRCRDPDDQMFIDLALAMGARWLLTRDRALLALARPARRGGLEVLTPARWAASGGAD